MNKRDSEQTPITNDLPTYTQQPFHELDTLCLHFQVHPMKGNYSCLVRDIFKRFKSMKTKLSNFHHLF